MLQAQVRGLNEVIASLKQKLPATALILESVTLYDQTGTPLITIKGNIMSLTIQKAGNYVIGTLLPIAGQDSSGNNIPSEIKAGSVVAYSIDSSVVGAITPNPANPLQFKVATVAGAANGSTTIRWSGVNDNGVAITGSDTFALGGTTPPPPLATGFAVTYGPETDPTVTPAPF